MKRGVKVRVARRDFPKRIAPLENLESKVLDWVRIQRNENKPVTGKMIRNKALDLNDSDPIRLPLTKGIRPFRASKVNRN